MHVIVVDLGFGDCGKGTVVDWLCATRDVHTVVRFNGGAQAAHTVVLADGRKHTFAQFGSGTLRGVRTHLSRFTVVDPLALVTEAEHLTALGVTGVWRLLTVDRSALIATPYHREANRAKERARGAGRHGSCGMGVGESMSYREHHADDAPTVGDCLDPPTLRRKLALLRDRLGVGGPPVDDCVRAYEGFAATVPIVEGMRFDDGPCVFEGAQGVLLDEWHGFHPYTTWSTTTFANALDLLGGRPAYRLGVLRTITTRHGAGPLVTEDPALGITDPNNPANPWQGAFRVGHFDAVAHRYALDVAGGVDGLALTHLDLPVDRMCTSYGGVTLRPGPPGDLARQSLVTQSLARAEPRYTSVTDWKQAVEDTLGAPVVVQSWGPTAEDKTTLHLSRTTAAPQPVV
ncbi:adenylosuccinate synthetase [Dactylosporangium sp. AC04546]|uniref:adenylosuccinate synthetase n=1 Tax=Dactylosporangium sp. AC04546 TaxID=2862460 RepID=UPI001EDE5373|nr:adenylosuccinate synthetase [Dactylosporangium sp. AC04546]WVK86080.1 adenylosuccinate synthetase [Dactylosporangium sp. AC04546]